MIGATPRARWQTIAVLVVTTGCGAQAPAASRPERSERLAVTVYQAADRSLAIVDDVRWLTTDGETLVLDHIDPQLALSSLTIQPVAGGQLAIGACHRDRIDPVVAESDAEHDDDAAAAPPLVASAIQCDVSGAPGQRLIRMTYTSSELRLDATHHVHVIDGDRAELVTKLAVTTLPLGRRGELVVFRGLPGRRDPPVEVVRGAMTFDGSTAIVTSPLKTIAAFERRILDPDHTTLAKSPLVIWVFLELGIELIDGAITVKAPSDTEPSHTRASVVARGRTRVPLRVDPKLHGRVRVDAAPSPGGIEAVYTVEVTSLDDRPREVWVEHRVPHTAVQRLVGGGLNKPTLDGDIVTAKLIVPPLGVERTEFRIRLAK